MARTRLRLRRLALALGVVLAAQGGVSLLLLVPRVRAVLRARLERAVGRPVEVGHFGVSVWSGLRLEADYITVGEDPKYGHEFVLRADRLSATPRWTSLLRGRLEFSSYSFERPSLNLVRTPDAHWNFETWAWGTGEPAAGGGGARGARVDSVRVSNGRINFKRGDDKLPFALTNVNGRLSPAPDGRWTISLEAQPLRAGVTLQDAGALRFAGTLPVTAPPATGAASAALPVEFALDWSRVSLSDALRLISGSDYGMRGSLEGSLNGRFSRDAPAAPAAGGVNGVATEEGLNPPAWKISAGVRIADVHRWDLPLQAGAPALNAAIEAAGSANRREWELREIVVEARRSKLRGAGAFRLGENARASLRVVSASIHADDLLAWYRAFHPGVRPGTVVDGYLGADVALEGWPVRVVHATLATTGVRLSIPGETRPIELRRAVLEADPKGARLLETQLAAGSDDSGVRLAGHASWTAGIPFEAHLAGGTSHLAEFSTALAALGILPGANPVRAEGSATVRLDCQGMARPWRLATTGSVTAEDAALSGGLLRSAITIGKARLDILPAGRHLQISAAKAFGATWTGTLGAATLAGPWNFALSADALNPALVIRGFSNQPPEDSSLLSRFLPAQAAATLALEAPRWPGWLRGEGTLTADTFEVGRLQFERLKSRLSIGEREIRLDGAEAIAFGGRVRGEARADFGEQPRYKVRVDFDGLNVAPLASVALSTRECCTGTGAGHLELTASGWNRDALFSSLAGTGRAQVRGGALLTFDLPASLEAGAVRPGRTALQEASADFVMDPAGVRLERLHLGVQSKSLAGQGIVNYRGELDVSITGGVRPLPAAASSQPIETVRVAGTLAAPQTAPR